MQSKTSDTLQKHIHDILADARYAPSVHNTQPWQISVEDGALEVRVDTRHELHDGDPTGRETIISLGIFCGALELAAMRYGLQATDITLKDKVARINFRTGRPDEREADHNIKLLKRRCTDRSLYKPAIIGTSLIDKLQAAPSSSGVNVHVVIDRRSLNAIADLTSKGIALALSSPGFRRELSRYLTVPWSRFKRGISTSSLAIFWPLAIVQPTFMRLGWQTSAEASLERRRWESASAVVAITAAGDMPQHWLNVGLTYLHVSLIIEDAGLSQATSAATVEASNFHEDIEQLLDTSQRALAMIRIGKGGKPRHYSSRVNPDELIASS